ncbi:hypothetical protein N0V93_004625 [Gnomoniopsis smithogilvyi]|uniref:Cytochrome P450 n=1 Tax=Gnomoniopsis smithogilvyi TaxID=1191159 RepID=A0A9W8YRE3_9PEZI|nr:hypothetical protein N0V93_004625 [Gnomoniopsis smithogilvyi]
MVFILPVWVNKLKTWQKYCTSHSKFSVEAGQGQYLWLEDPWSKARNYWLCHHAAIKHVFSRAAISQTDHRAGFDWFHYAGWEIPTMDPKYRTTVRNADQTVHSRLAKSKLASLLDKVREIGYSEIQRFKKAAGSDGRFVSLHTLMYRLGYNVNCIGIFGPQLDHVETRVILQTFTEDQHMLFASFNWPLPIWLSTLVIPGARRTARARKRLFSLLFKWYKAGGVQSASPELKAIVQVFEDVNASPDIGSKFLNMMMIAFLANTPETLGWLFTHITQTPQLFSRIREECDALGEEYALNSINFKQATPYLYSAFFETFRLYVFTGTPVTVIRPCKLPGMGDHIFQPGDILHSMGEAAAMDIEVYGDDAQLWKGHRFVGEGGEDLLKYDLTFGIGRSPCPGRNFAIAELCMLAARSRVHRSASEGDGLVNVIDLDGKIKRIIHPGNSSDHGVPGMTAANIPLYDFACKLTPRKK